MLTFRVKAYSIDINTKLVMIALYTLNNKATIKLIKNFVKLTRANIWKSIRWLIKIGLVNSYSTGKFKPNIYSLTDEGVTILKRHYKGKDKKN